MSFFPCADSAKFRAAMQHNCAASYQSQPSPAENTSSTVDARASHNGWSTSVSSPPESMFAPSVESHNWSMRDQRGLGLQSIPYSSPGNMFVVGATLAPSMETQTAWLSHYDAAQAFPQQPHASAPAKDLRFYNYEAQSPSSLPASAAWESMPSTTSTSSFTVQNAEMSPGRSDYSTPSQASAVESPPYAQSDIMFQPSAGSPFIKTEEPLDVAKPRVYSLPGFMALDQSMIVNPGDVYNSPSMSMSDQQSLLGMPQLPMKGEEGSAQHHHAMCRAHSLEEGQYMDDCDDDSASERQKRGYTTQANSTCSCDKCGKLFQRSYNLKAHMETHDPHRDQPHACHHPGCLRRFVRRTDLLRHEQSVHLKARNHLCDYCHGSFARKDTLRRHMDDGCPKRPEVRKRSSKSRRSSSVSKSRRTSYHAPMPDYLDHHRVARHHHLAHQYV